METDTKPVDASWSHGEAPREPRSGSTASGVITLIVTVFLILCACGVWASHHQTATVTTCNQVLQTCTQQTYSVQTAP